MNHRRIKISKENLQQAAEKNLLPKDQVEPLFEFLKNDISSDAQFTGINVLYYFGALLIISAMTWFMTTAWEAFGGGGIAFVSTVYALFFLGAGLYLWNQQNLKTPGGLLVTAAVSIVPLIIYGIQRYFGYWEQNDPGNYRGFHQWINGSWFFMEIGTITAGMVALRFVRFPFLIAPIAFSFWYISMDLAPLIFGANDYNWDHPETVSVYFGFLMLIIFFMIDRRTKEDFAFWGYLFGLMAFWGGLSMMEGHGEKGKALYCLINIGLIIFSVLLNRKVFMVFGSLGVFGYLCDLAYAIFEDSMFFPLALCLIGLSIIFLGVQYQRNYDSISKLIENLVPLWFKKHLPAYRNAL